MNEDGTPGAPQDTGASQSVRDYIEAARQHHARTGEWPPDPILDEVAAMRRRILAEHDDDYNKVLEWYVQLGKERANGNGHPQQPVEEERSTHVSGR